MRKLLLLIAIFISLKVSAQTYYTPSIPPGSTSFSPTFRFNGTDSLAKYYLNNANRWSRLYTATEINAKFTPSINPNSVVSGLTMSVFDSLLTVAAGAWNINGVGYSKGTTSNFVLSARDTIYSRYETVYATNTNTIGIVVGSLSPTPFEPAIPTGTLRVGSVLITPTGTIVYGPGVSVNYVLSDPTVQQYAFPWVRTMQADTFKTAHYIFPSVDGTSAQVLQTDGSGHLYWSSQAIYTPGFGMHLNAQAFSVDTTKIVTTVALLDTLRKNAAHFNPKQFIIGNDTINLNPRDTTTVDSVLGMKGGRLYKGKSSGGSILSQAYGIIPFSYTGASPATVGVDTNKIAISNDMILSGMVTTISGPTTANTTAGTYRLSGTVYSIGSTNTTIPAQDATLNRYSVIYATTAGLSISNGSLAADPQIPNVPIGDLLVSTIYIPAVGGTVTPGGGNGGKINANNGLTLKNNQLQLGGPLVHTTNISLTTQTPLTFNNAVNNDNFQVTYGGISASYANGGANTTSLQVSPSQALFLINQGGSSQTGIDLDYTYGYRVLDNVFHRGMIFGGNYTTNQRLQRLSVPSVGTTIALIDSVKATISSSTGANPTALIGFVPVNGSASTFTRSDGAAAADSTTIRSVANSYSLSGMQTKLNNYVLTSALLNHVAGYGLSGSNYNTSVSQTWTADTTSSTGLVSKSRLATNLGGYVKTVSVASANGLSGTSSGGQTPALTLTLNTIKPNVVAQTPAGTAGTDSVMVKHSDGTMKAISPTYYGTSGGGLTSANFVYGEVPTGSINGTNTTFTLANTPTSGTVRIYLNGVRQLVATNYTISGSTYTMNFPPQTGDTLVEDYMK